MDPANTIAIIGAGIGGLAAALALLRQGLDVDVYEQSPELGEIGAGIQISANGTRVLYALGLETALHGIEVLPSRRQNSSLEHGRDLGLVRAGRGHARALRHAPRDAALLMIRRRSAL